MISKRIQNAIDVFLDALNEGTLAKGSCVACAIGNLVAKGLNGKITQNKYNFKCNIDNTAWSDLFYTSEGEQILSIRKLDDKDVLKNINSTEFSWEELAKIEFTFETNTEIQHSKYNQFSKKEIRQDQIKGLEAIVQLMLTFDENKEDVKEVFTNKAELITI